MNTQVTLLPFTSSHCYRFSIIHHFPLPSRQLPSALEELSEYELFISSFMQHICLTGAREHNLGCVSAQYYLSLSI